MNTKMLLSPHDIIDSFTSLSHLHPQLLINDHIPSFLLSLDDVTEATTKSASAVVEAASPYSKIDKTGVIGFIASYVELAIDGGHSLLQSAGVKYSYGFSIIIFTLFGKKTICMYVLYIYKQNIYYLFMIINTSVCFTMFLSMHLLFKITIHTPTHTHTYTYCYI